MALLGKSTYGDTAFVTGLRAVAALAVVLIHTGGAGLRAFGAFGNALADMGSAGVFAFFVISGFSVSSSLEGRPRYAQYLKRRLLRIVPLYFFWLGVALAFGLTAAYWQQELNAPVDPYAVFMHVSFLSVFDYRVTNNILGVEWSIPIEVFWYLVLPLMVIAARRTWGLIALLVGGFVVYEAAMRFAPLLPVAHPDLAMKWSPVPYAFSYALGVAAFRLRKSPPGWAGDAAMLGVVALVLAAAAAPGISSDLFEGEVAFVSLLTFALLLFGSARSTAVSALLCNPVSQLIGVVSYGLYLSHMPVIAVLKRAGWLPQDALPAFVVVAAVAVGASVATYYAIERPFLAPSPRWRRAAAIPESPAEDAPS